MKFERKKLKYRLDELPVLSEKLMDEHYNVLHKNYEEGLNKLLSQYSDEISNKNISYDKPEELIKHYYRFPLKMQYLLRHFGGGLVNHNLFFSILSPEQGKKLGKDDKLRKEIENSSQFGSIDKLKDELLKGAVEIHGSGWMWLVLDDNKKLKLYKTSNQNSPWAEGYKPIIGIDVWEHAYYLDYLSNRREYVKQLLTILDWQEIENIFNDSMK